LTTSQGSPLPYVDISTIHRFRASIENVRTNDDVYISFHLSLSLIHTEESHPSKPDGKKGLSACNSFQMHGCDSISGTLGFSLASFRPPRLPIEHTLIENRTRNNKEQESLSTVHVCFLFVFKLHFFVSIFISCINIEIDCCCCAAAAAASLLAFPNYFRDRPEGSTAITVLVLRIKAGILAGIICCCCFAFLEGLMCFYF